MAEKMNLEHTPAPDIAKAKAEGEEAYALDKPKDENPYTSGPMRWAWNQGWSEAWSDDESDDE